MSFKIIIEETTIRTELKGKEWAIIGTKEIPRDADFVGEKGSPTRIDNVFGYTPQIEKDVYVTREVLTQVVETLDLAAVIKAINKL